MVAKKREYIDPVNILSINDTSVLELKKGLFKWLKT